MSKLKSFIKTSCILLSGLFITHTSLVAQELKKDTVITGTNLGEVVVKGSAPSQNSKVSAEKIQMNEKDKLSDAMGLIPGVLTVAGAKTDMVYLHGFDLRQVPVYYDGVPIYIPYDGYLDLGMLNTTDVDQISVSNGTSSILYGPNALGGAINIVTSKPRKGISGNGKIGTFTNGKYSGLASVGYGTDKFYVKGTFSILDKNNYELSNDYKQIVTIEDGGKLDNSYYKTSQISFKAGYTPSANHEFALSYIKHNGEKGIQPYLGTNGTARYWKFPVYDKESIYLLANNKLTNSVALKTRLYYDKFDNTLDSYDDTTYTTQKKKYAFTSIYDDYSVGGIATLSQTTKSNTAVLDIQVKYDDHKEHNVGNPVCQMTDQSAVASLVDNYFINKFMVHGGVSLNYEKGLKAQYLNSSSEVTEYPKNDNKVINGEFNLSYNLTADHQLKGGVAYKTRFPTMKNRYSLSLGKSIANPELKPENSMNYTVDYTGSAIKNKLSFSAGMFYSKLADAILSVYGVDTTNASIYQLQNTGKAEYYGADATVSYFVLPALNISMNYSKVIRNNLSSPDVKFTDVPENTFHASVVYRFKNKSYINVNTESYSDRYTTSGGLKVGGYTLLNCKGSFYVYKSIIGVEAGVNNIFDKNYQVSDGYPMPGRNCFVSAIATF